MIAIKKIITVAAVLASMAMHSQARSYIFYFNGKKLKREVAKQPEKVYTVTLFSAYGEKLNFKVSENQISEQKIPGMLFFKGKSENGSRIISFTLRHDKISGSFSDNGKEVYFEPTKRRNYYKSYEIQGVKAGQENDEVKDAPIPKTSDRK
ncbi:hypothetical protein SAMN05421594_2443 [Chryseobacterium oleae]|uniref:Uncharacterized protein n=1 Tax=Chryseobacterium oleae TaxID=491207 RepID=A0A1I4YIE2_CHROL|nr:hypothetical protein [Chryseobacterium oleae]SFN37801.1 hypothetical protein SAMN05421594_2443 [Chryseobacterium oleae]